MASVKTVMSRSSRWSSPIATSQRLPWKVPHLLDAGRSRQVVGGVTPALSALLVTLLAWAGLVEAWATGSARSVVLLEWSRSAGAPPTTPCSSESAPTASADVTMAYDGMTGAPAGWTLANANGSWQQEDESTAGRLRTWTKRNAAGAVVGIPPTTMSVMSRLPSGEQVSLVENGHAAAEALLEVASRGAGELQGMANEIRTAANHPAAANMRTIAFGKEGDQLFCTGCPGMDPGQRAKATEMGIEIIKPETGLHAEETLLKNRPGMTDIGTSKRAPCGASEHNYAGQLDAAGVKVDNQ